MKANLIGHSGRPHGKTSSKERNEAQWLIVDDEICPVIEHVATNLETSYGRPVPKLICSFTDYADKDGLSVIALVAPLAKALFEWAGFHEIARLDPQTDSLQITFMLHRSKATMVAKIH